VLSPITPSPVMTTEALSGTGVRTHPVLIVLGRRTWLRAGAPATVGAAP
jgi:hypothetical protein